MEFRAFSKQDIQQAARLLAQRHRAERKAFPSLRSAFEDHEQTKKILEELVSGERVRGICAYERDTLLGYLLARIDTDAANDRCAIVGYEGLALAETESPELYRKLYAEAAKLWVADGALTHSIVAPAGDTAGVDAWLRASFAYQQVYGIASLREEKQAESETFTIRRAEASDREALESVANLISAYQAASPVYAAMSPERAAEIKQGYGELPMEKNGLLLLAHTQDELAGFLYADREMDDDNMLIPENAFEIGVCGVVEADRGRGAGSLLTKNIFNKGLEWGYQNVIVDWRIANLASSVFWPKRGFVPFAYRMVRMINEKVYWANGVAGE